jgi:hypothetical protein
LDEAQQAAVQYEICLLDSGGTMGTETAVLYQTLYNQTPNVKYKRRYERLTGETLPPPPELPPLPQVVTAFAVTTEALQKQVERFIEEFTD